MGLMDSLFGRRESPAPAPAAPNPVNNPAKNPAPAQPASSAQTAPNGVIPADGAQAPAGEQSPLAKYEQLWEPPKAEEGQQGQQGQQNFAANVDPAKILEAATKVDFGKSVNRELLTKVASGGEEAVAALAQILNQQSQQVYGQSMVAVAKIVEQAVSQAEDRFSAQIPDVLRRHGARERVFDDNPAFKNPAVAPLIEAQVQQLAAKYPKATPAELQGMAKEYLAGVAALISPPKAAASSSQSKTSEHEDFSDWLPQSRPFL